MAAFEQKQVRARSVNEAAEAALVCVCVHVCLSSAVSLLKQNFFYLCLHFVIRLRNEILHLQRWEGNWRQDESIFIAKC